MSRLLAISRLLDAIGMNTLRLIWAAVLLVILASAGRWLWQSQMVPGVEPVDERSVPVVIDWSEVDTGVAEALASARNRAQEHAQAGLTRWRATLLDRIDNDFLDWYFSYWTQQKLGLQGIYQGGIHWISSDQASAAEAITHTIQLEFAARVLRPPISQLLLERLSRETLDIYVSQLRSELAPLPERYRIPQGEWQRYLDGIAVLTHGVEGDRQVALSLKALTTSGLAGSVILAKALTPALASLGSKVSASMAGKGAAVLAAKSGAKVAASGGGKLLGPIIGLGILVWDLWDHNQTREENLPLLRRALVDYLEEMTRLLRDDPDSGVMSVILQMEQTIHQSITQE